MNFYQRKVNLLLILFLFCFALKGFTKVNQDESHAKVVMRLIGHNILLASGDVSSLVLPVEKIEDRYKIHFGREFKLDPQTWGSVIDSVMNANDLSHYYRVEIEKCDGDTVVHSYEFSDSIQPFGNACSGRILPNDCYNLFITLMDSLGTDKSLIVINPQTGNKAVLEEMKINYFKSFLLVMVIVLPIGLYFYFRKKNKPLSKFDSEVIPIGKYMFDKRNMTLFIENKKTSLTSKEADLLYVLYTSANTVLQRENILSEVWGDEGDYIGRTLDVFISKLRKKLSADSNLKIVNIHGVGYKFVVNN